MRCLAQSQEKKQMKENPIKNVELQRPKLSNIELILATDWMNELLGREEAPYLSCRHTTPLGSVAG